MLAATGSHAQLAGGDVSPHYINRGASARTPSRPAQIGDLCAARPTSAVEAGLPIVVSHKKVDRCSRKAHRQAHPTPRHRAPGHGAIEVGQGALVRIARFWSFNTFVPARVASLAPTAPWQPARVDAYQAASLRSLTIGNLTTRSRVCPHRLRSDARLGRLSKSMHMNTVELAVALRMCP